MRAQGAGGVDGEGSRAHLATPAGRVGRARAFFWLADRERAREGVRRGEVGAGGGPLHNRVECGTDRVGDAERSTPREMAPRAPERKLMSQRWRARNATTNIERNRISKIVANDAVNPMQASSDRELRNVTATR